MMRRLGPFYIALMAASLLAGCGILDRSASFPSRPITGVSAYEAGAFTDTLVRPAWEIMGKELGQPIMVVNKPGAGGTVGLRDVAESKPDGYTIGVCAALAYAKQLGQININHRDLDVIGVVAAAPPGLWVRADSPWKTTKDLVEAAKAKPGQITLSTSSAPGHFWLVVKMFEKQAGITFNIVQATGGGAMATQQLAGEQVESGVFGFVESQSMYQAGKIRPLAVFGANRLPDPYKDIPTALEQGYSIKDEGNVLVPMVGPKGMPKEALDKLRASMLKASGSQEYLNAVGKYGASPAKLAGDEAMAYLDQMAKTFEPLIEGLGLKK